MPISGLHIVKAGNASADSPTEERMVYGEVYAPDRPDSGGDFMRAEDIKTMAHNFMKNLRLKSVDVNHNNEVQEDVTVVESFIAREDDPLFIPGSWVVGVHVNNDQVWEDIKAGKLNGFSIEALAKGEDVEVDVEVPPVVSGLTNDVQGHTHKFFVSYDKDGAFLGGKTDVVDGHQHLIRAGTFTETANGHSHRFSAVDDIQIAPDLSVA